MSVAAMEKPEAARDQAGTLTYAFQPRLGASGTEITLAGDVLTYTMGPREGRIDLRDVAGVSLLFLPAKFAQSSFEMRLRTWDKRRLKVSSVSRVSLTQIKNQAEAYTVFVEAVHRRLAHLDTSGAILGHPKVVFTGGYSHIRWWLTAVVGLVALAVLVGIFGMALIDRQWPFAAFVAALSAFTALPTVEMITRNKPVRYRPDAIPPELLPD